MKWRETKGKVTRSNNKVAEKSMENVSCQSESNTHQCGFSQTISSSHQFNDVYCVICSVGDANRLCVFCSRPCHPFQPCGSFLKPGYGGGVICQNPDKELLQPIKPTKYTEDFERHFSTTYTKYRFDDNKKRMTNKSGKDACFRKKQETMTENAAIKILIMFHHRK